MTQESGQVPEPIINAVLPEDEEVDPAGLGVEVHADPATIEEPAFVALAERYFPFNPRSGSIVSGLVFAVFFSLMACQPLIERSFVRLFEIKGEGLIQDPPITGLPLPHMMAWPGFMLEVICGFGQLRTIAVVTLYAILALVPFYALLKTLNPTFRLVTEIDWNRGLVFHTYMHTPPMIKALLLTVMGVVPVFGVWVGSSYLLKGSLVAPAISLVFSGMVAWLLYSRNGLASDYDSYNYGFPREKGELGGLAVRGAAVGLVTFASMMLARNVELEGLLLFYRSLGYIGEPVWWKIAILYLGTLGGCAFVVGWLVVALGRPGLDRAVRGRLCVVPSLTLLGLAIWTNWMAMPRIPDYDFNPDPKAPVAPRIQKATQISDKPGSTQTVLLLTPNGAVPANASGKSGLGLDTSPDAIRKMEAYLKSKSDRSSLTGPVFQGLYDAYALQWDSNAQLQTAYRNLVSCPETGFLKVYLDKLRTVAATPEAVRYADLLADPRVFNHEDHEGKRLIGDIYARLGQRDKAKTWYTAARIPPRRLEAVLAERVMFNEGKVSGVLKFNGRAIPNARVGVLPSESLNDRRMMDEEGNLRAFWFRNISAYAQTDKSGRFEIKSLVAGFYVLIITSTDLKLPAGTGGLPTLITPNPLPERILVAFANKNVDLGEINIMLPPQSAPNRLK